MKERITQAIGALPPASGFVGSGDVDVYPSSGKLVVGLRIAKASDSDPNAGRWVYLAGALQADESGHAVRLSGLGVTTDDEALAPVIDPTSRNRRPTR